MTTASCDCVCGDRVVVIVGKEKQGVAAHNATSAHRQWRAQGGMEREVYGPSPHELFVDAIVEQWHHERGLEVER